MATTPWLRLRGLRRRDGGIVQNSTKMGVHNPRGELKGPQTTTTFRQVGRRAEFGFACGRGGLGAGSLLGVPVSALRALWMIKIKMEEKSCILTYFEPFCARSGEKNSKKDPTYRDDIQCIYLIY